MTLAPRREQAIVLLHSLGTDSEIWRGARQFFPSSYRVVAPDAMGHGVRLTGPISEQAWIDDLDQLVDGLGDVDVHLVGLSMGGVQALAYTSQHPNKVASLVLANTFAYLEPEVSEARITGIGGRVNQLGMSAHAQAYVDETIKTGKGSPAAVQLYESIAMIPAELYMESVRATFSVDFRGALANISVPTLVVHAEYDDKTPRPLSDYLQREITLASLVSIPGAGHLSAFDQPERFADELSVFFERVGSLNDVVKEQL